MSQDSISSAEISVSLPHKHSFSCHLFQHSPFTVLCPFSILFFTIGYIKSCSTKISTRYMIQLEAWIFLLSQSHQFYLVQHISAICFYCCSLEPGLFLHAYYSSLTCHLKQIASFSLPHQFIPSSQISVTSIDIILALCL